MAVCPLDEIEHALPALSRAIAVFLRASALFADLLREMQNICRDAFKLARNLYVAEPIGHSVTERP